MSIDLFPGAYNPYDYDADGNRYDLREHWECEKHAERLQKAGAVLLRVIYDSGVAYDNPEVEAALAVFAAPDEVTSEKERAMDCPICSVCWGAEAWKLADATCPECLQAQRDQAQRAAVSACAEMVRKALTADWIADQMVGRPVKGQRDNVNYEASNLAEDLRRACIKWKNIAFQKPVRQVAHET